MSTLTISLVVCGIAVLALIAVVLFRQSQRNRRPANLQASQGALVAVQNDGVNYPSPVVTQNELPSAIYFGTDIQNPAVTLRPIPLAKADAFESVPVVNPSLGVASRVSALMQAAPSLLVAQSQSGRQLMEVVVNGPLVRAADGNGFRAMTVSGGGIKEHADFLRPRIWATWSMLPRFGNWLP